ncbi:MAG: hemin uptake protein HemP [Candidatus Thiodiazotropha sp.]
MTRKIPASTPAQHLSQLAGSPSRTLESRDLMQGRSQIEIVHRGEIYRLRITRQGKLILTK